MQKECPLCGDRRCASRRAKRSRACPAPRRKSGPSIREWVCRECDYFEEAEETGSTNGLERRA